MSSTESRFILEELKVSFINNNRSATLMLTRLRFVSPSIDALTAFTDASTNFAKAIKQNEHAISERCKSIIDSTSQNIAKIEQLQEADQRDLDASSSYIDYLTDVNEVDTELVRQLEQSLIDEIIVPTRQYLNEVMKLSSDVLTKLAIIDKTIER